MTTGQHRRYVSDGLVDLMAAAGIDRVAFNPGATVRGLHDSIVQDPDGRIRPVLCMHEAVAVAAAHGWVAATGRPMAVMLHDVVGVQSAAMAIYNAWCDRAPILIIGGSGPASKAARRPWIDWIHAASAQGEAVRDYVVWDDEPRDAASIPESFARAVEQMTASPGGPVYLCIDAELAEQPLAEQMVPWRAPLPRPPAGSHSDIEAVARALTGARRPLILAGHLRGGPDHMLERVVELTQAVVLDTGVRLAAATDAPWVVTGAAGVLGEADAVLALETDDIAARLAGRRSGHGVVHVSTAHLRARSWSHDYQQLAEDVEVITASPETFLAELAAELENHPRSVACEWEPGLGAEHRRARREVALARGSGEHMPTETVVAVLGEVLAGRHVVVANGTNDRHELELMDLTPPDGHLGWHGGGGLGHGVGATIGAAMGAPDDAVVVDLQADGDLLYLPSALWTLANQELGAVVVLLDNGQYGNTVGHALDIAAERGRSQALAGVGSALDSPGVDHAALASSMGVEPFGPVSDADGLRAAVTKAVATADAGRPALVWARTSPVPVPERSETEET